MRPVLRKRLLLCLLMCLGWLSGYEARAADSPLRLASFNIQIFGQSKMKKAAAVSTLLRILDRYDLVFIMEIRDSNDSAIYSLLDQLNKDSKKNYQIIVSERLGRSDSKEQYAYLYNADKIEPTHSYVWPDREDKFEREPYVARFQAGSIKFSMIGIHVTPGDVAKELKALSGVYDDEKKVFGKDIFIVGDFNADCAYYKSDGKFKLFDDPATPLVPEGADTTVASTVCTYDRVLAFGDLPRSSTIARPFDFQAAYGLDLAAALEVSDHYPVEWTLDEARDAGAPIDEPPVIVTPPATPTKTCGLNPYLTPKNYCYADFQGVPKRVANACCPR